MLALSDVWSEVCKFDLGTTEAKQENLLKVSSQSEPLLGFGWDFSLTRLYSELFFFVLKLGGAPFDALPLQA